MTRPAPGDEGHEPTLRVGPPKTVAAGLPGVWASVQHARDQLGVRRAAATLLKVNQPDGFDCPGCAWPDPHHASHLEFCENGAKAVAEEATVRRVGPEFFATHSVDELAAHTDHWLGQQGRLTHPVYRPPGSDHYRPIDWDDAFGVVADALTAAGDPDRAVFYTSGRTSNEAAFLYQLLVRQLGTNNLPDCSNLCHESSGVALVQTLGVGKGSVSLEDVHNADLIIVAGQNPGTNHPRMLTALELAKARGATIVAVNPMPEAGLMRFKNPQRIKGVAGRGTVLADEFLQIKLGADLALFQWLNRRLVELDRERGGVLDRAFLDESCEGLEELVAHLEAVDAAALLAATGLPRDQVERFAELVALEEPHHPVLGHGHHPTPSGGAHHSGDGQHAPAAGQHRPAGRRGLPRARAQQRPGRPHDGHRREALGRRSSRRSVPSSRSNRRGATATTSSRPSGPWPAVRSTCSWGWAATSWRPRPTPTQPPPRWPAPSSRCRCRPS